MFEQKLFCLFVCLFVQIIQTFFVCTSLCSIIVLLSLSLTQGEPGAMGLPGLEGLPGPKVSINTVKKKKVTVSAGGSVYSLLFSILKQK